MNIIFDLPTAAEALMCRRLMSGISLEELGVSLKHWETSEVVEGELWTYGLNIDVTDSMLEQPSAS